MKLPPLSLVVLDTETTGFVPRVHRVIEYAAMRIEDGKIVDEYEQLFAHKEVPPVVEVLTRIKTADLAGKPTFEEKKMEILSLIPDDAILVGQNIGFDLGMLKGEGLDLSERPWIDTSMLASLVFPELESYSLGYLSTVLKLNHTPKHRALGDVRATMELLGKVWERLLELPAKRWEEVQHIIDRSPAGYRRLFQALKPAGKKDPAWLSTLSSTDTGKTSAQKAVELTIPEVGKPQLVEEPLDPGFLAQLVGTAIADTSTTHWIAVKNLEAALHRLPEGTRTHKDFRVLYPTFLLKDPDGEQRLLGSENFTNDEATLAMKLRWYKPTVRADFPLHGGEEAVWNGKVATTPTSDAYIAQYANAPKTLLLDHRQLLEALIDEDHPMQALMSDKTHVIIDDASMLEDTATKAYGWNCSLDDVRAAAQGDTLLTKFTDLFQLWIEKVRQFQDIRYLSIGDLRTPEASGLRTQTDEVMKTPALSPQVRRHLECLKKILDPENLANRLAWIEQRQNGSQFIQSVPERIGLLLQEHLYARCPTTLLIPSHLEGKLPEIIVSQNAALAVSLKLKALSLPITVKNDGVTLEYLLTQPPKGKTIVLLPGKSTIEDLYVKYAEKLEEAGTTLISQGVSGGQGRMQAEFLAASAPTIWLITPWTFEGIDLPAGTVDHLYLKALPFDHPSHPVTSRRSQHYRDGFGDYCVPRLLHRLFRLLRTFCRFKTAHGDVFVLDERLFSKSYGKNVREYLANFASTMEEEGGGPVKIQTETTSVKKTAKKKSDDAQMKMF